MKIKITYRILITFLFILFTVFILYLFFIYRPTVPFKLMGNISTINYESVKITIPIGQRDSSFLNLNESYIIQSGNKSTTIDSKECIEIERNERNLILEFHRCSKYYPEFINRDSVTIIYFGKSKSLSLINFLLGKNVQ